MHTEYRGGWGVTTTGPCARPTLLNPSTTPAVHKMPLRDGVEHVPSLGLPPGIAAGTEVLVCRFTGEVFVDYR